MSALGHERTLERRSGMSALLPKNGHAQRRHQCLLSPTSRHLGCREHAQSATGTRSLILSEILGALAVATRRLSGPTLARIAQSRWCLRSLEAALRDLLSMYCCLRGLLISRAVHPVFPALSTHLQDRGARFQQAGTAVAVALQHPEKQRGYRHHQRIKQQQQGTLRNHD